MNIIDIAYSGSQAAQANLQIMAMNNSNVDTKGYSRQRLQQSAIGPQSKLNSGGGVQVDSIRRIAEQYIISRVWESTSENEYYHQKQHYLSSLETLIGNESTGLGEGLNSFFNALHSCTGKPDNTANRSAVINEARALATRFSSANHFIDSQQKKIKDQRTAILTDINTLTKNIASYNEKITELGAEDGNVNVLRDQRDELIKKLSGYVDLNVVENDKNQYSITLKSGRQLVNGNSSGELAVNRLPDGTQGLQVSYPNDPSTYSVSMACGGSLGGLYDYQTGTLKDMQDKVKGMAKTIADEFNTQLHAGIDLNGAHGKPLFNYDENKRKGMLQINDLSPNELAFADQPGEPGDGANLQQLINVKDKPLTLARVTGSTTLIQEAAAIVNTIGSVSQQNKSDLIAATNMLNGAQAQRDNLSAVNRDEEVINLLTFIQAYQSNLKVISTGKQLFSDLLALF